MGQRNRRETMSRFGHREQQEGNKKRRGEKRRKRLNHTMTRGRKKLAGKKLKKQKPGVSK